LHCPHAAQDDATTSTYIYTARPRQRANQSNCVYYGIRLHPLRYCRGSAHAYLFRKRAERIDGLALIHVDAYFVDTELHLVTNEAEQLLARDLGQLAMLLLSERCQQRATPPLCEVLQRLSILERDDALAEKPLVRRLLLPASAETTTVLHGDDILAVELCGGQRVECGKLTVAAEQLEQLDQSVMLVGRLRKRRVTLLCSDGGVVVRTNALVGGEPTSRERSGTGNCTRMAS